MLGVEVEEEVEAVVGFVVGLVEVVVGFVVGLVEVVVAPRYSCM